jgi:hypothetical protein
MSRAHLDQLEQAVEDARARLAHNIVELRSPASVADLKQGLADEATQKKDELIGLAKESAVRGAHQLLSQLKEKAEANPAAALAIGAGVAWRLARRPPIASMLVGIGLVSLWRTPERSPREKAMSRGFGPALATQAADLAGIASDKAQEWAQAAGGTMADIGGQLMEKTADVTGQASDAVTAGARQFGEKASAVAAQASAAIHDADPGEDVRDKMLLGLAALAVATAAGIAYRRD